MVDGCDTFSRFFQEKIDNLQINLHRTTAVDPEPGETPCFTVSIEVFEPTTTAEISNILGIAGKTRILDPLSTKQLTDNVKCMVPIVTYVTNAPPENAVMPALFKHAIVRPLLKTQSLNKDILNNYRPISNLSHLAKVIEKVVTRRIISHISEQRMQDCFQSAYRKNHSTETALLCVTNAMKAAMDNRQGTALVLIDFSAAFDTVNYNIMIRRLQLRYGVVGKALAWLQSYLEGRTQRVVIRDASSNTTRVTSGVPQGSVQVPLLFSLYVQPIGDIITAHGLCLHHYADHPQ